MQVAGWLSSWVLDSQLQIANAQDFFTGELSLDVAKKIRFGNIAIAKGPAQGVSVHLIVLGKDDASAISMLHHHVAASPVYFQKPH